MTQNKSRHGARNNKIIIGAIAAFVIAGALYICFPYICMIAAFVQVIVLRDEGKLDSVDKISDMVTENQDTLESLACLMLEQGEEFYVTVDAEEDEIKYINGSTYIDDDFIELEEIYNQLDELYIKSMAVYKNQDESKVVFTTYISGMAGSSSEKGFIYMPQGMPDNIFEDNFFKVYRHKSCENIVDDWYSYERDY